MLFLISEFIQLMTQFITKKSKMIGLAGILILAYIAGTVNPSTTTDYATYSGAYYYNYQPDNYYFERGYSSIAAFFLKHGWSYADFRLIFVLVSGIILFIAISRFTQNVAFFSFFYGATIFFNDATQVRNFMMMALVSLAMSFLIQINIKNIIISIIIIIVSAQFQSLGYIFILVVFIRLLPLEWISEHVLLLSAIILSVVGVAAVIGKNLLLKLATNIVASLPGRESLLDKVSGQYTYGTVITKLLLVIFAAFLAFLVENYFFRISLNQYSDDHNKIAILYSGVLLSLFTLPLLFLAVDYSRIQRNVWYFVLISAAIFFEHVKISVREKYLAFIMFILLSGSFAYTHTHVWGPIYEQSIPYIMRIKH